MQAPMCCSHGAGLTGTAVGWVGRGGWPHDVTGLLAGEVSARESLTKDSEVGRTIVVSILNEKER